jgi:hypothetical protein
MTEEFKQRWEEWYGDMLDSYQWNEIDYNSRKVLYVCGTTVIESDGRALYADVLQVMGYTDSEGQLDDVEQKEVTELLRGMHGVHNISFWIE